MLNVSAGCGSSAVSPSANASATAGAAPTCSAALWAHVYDPSRLEVRNACMTVTGTVDNAPHVSDDGDMDFHFVPDPQFQNLLNSANNGHLHVEAICQGAIQSDTPQAAQSCGAFKGSIAIPPPGTHVTITGPYVLDTNHGWMEIHPVNAIVITH
jgi:hypothetical protein